MRVALLQLDLAWEDVAENHRRAARLLARAKEGGATLAVLPEMFSIGFSMDAARIAQPAGGVSPMCVVPFSSTHLNAAPAAPA